MKPEIIFIKDNDVEETVVSTKPTPKKIFSSDLSSPDATVLLRIIEERYKDQLDHYKTVIFRKGLKAAITELSENANKSVGFINKVIFENRVFTKTKSKPFGNIRKVRREVKKDGENFVAQFITLEEFRDKCEKLLNIHNIDSADKNTMEKFFTPETFKKINNITLLITDRINVQLKSEIKICPFTNTIVDTKTVNPVNGIYYAVSLYKDCSSSTRKYLTIKDTINVSLDNKNTKNLRMLIDINIKRFKEFNIEELMNSEFKDIWND